MPSWFVTGSSRGIGLELVRQLATESSNVVLASCRNPSAASSLKEVQSSAKGKVHVLSLDVTDQKSIEAVEAEVKKLLPDGKLDYLVSNAAITAGDDRAFDLSVEDLNSCLQSNVVAPALLSKVLYPYISRSDRKVIAHITSGLASFGRDFGAINISYSVSKTALNMLAYKQAKEKPDMIVFVVDPGWVKTDMGGPDAHLQPHESVSGLLKLFTSATHEHSAGFFDYSGNRVPW